MKQRASAPIKRGPAAAVFLLLCAAAMPAGEVPARPETFLLLPEPFSMRSPRSLKPQGAQKTVLTPARETAASPFIEAYSAEELLALGISPETFAGRAAKAADRLLAGLQPEWIRDDQGQVLYAVYRGERPIYASLLVAPSLPALFEAAFGAEIWVTAPDRHALYIFPAKSAALGEFAADLQERYETHPYAATCEVFAWKKGQAAPLAVGTLAD